mmetsp:Transcript_30228/g.48830  ORF Transcript_30228/g.48830 Transcript_30228/m.48830 type:complete len:111 (-) Transcript_30228:219-551(-)
MTEFGLCDSLDTKNATETITTPKYYKIYNDLSVVVGATSDVKQVTIAKYYTTYEKTFTAMVQAGWHDTKPGTSPACCGHLSSEKVVTTLQHTECSQGCFSCLRGLAALFW